MACISFDRSPAGKLLEARRIKNEYGAAKRHYDQTCERFQAVSDTWDRVESMQAQEIRFTLERDIGMILQKACGLVNQTINQALQDSTFGGILFEVMKLDTSSGKRGVSVMQYPSSGPHILKMVQFGGVQLEEEISGNSQGVSSRKLE